MIQGRRENLEWIVICIVVLASTGCRYPRYETRRRIDESMVGSGWHKLSSKFAWGFSEAPAILRTLKRARSTIAFSLCNLVSNPSSY